MELHWEIDDRNGTWLRYLDCGHWGLVLTAVLPHWIIPSSWEQGIAQVRAT